MTQCPLLIAAKMRSSVCYDSHSSVNYYQDESSLCYDSVSSVNYYQDEELCVMTQCPLLIAAKMRSSVL